ncbi:tetratricopeptide repeat protein [Lysobacter tyrosinilyticus]
MKKVLLLSLLLLPACSRADDPCADLTDTAIGAALEDPTDTYNLAVEFYTGKCVEKDYGKAAKLWERAASSGVTSAKNNLGYLLSEGLGVKKDETRAAALWLEAARVGHAESQVHLGNAFFYGYGVPKDQVRGLAWVLHAAQAAVDDPDTGGGPAVLKQAQDEQAQMLKVAPELLEPAKAFIERLGVARHER